MVEAFYSIAKYSYLYLQTIRNYEELITAFKALLEEYHFERPHYALGIYTPSEVYNDENPTVEFSEIYKEAAKERREINAFGCELSCP